MAISQKDCSLILQELKNQGVISAEQRDAVSKQLKDQLKKKRLGQQEVADAKAWNEYAGEVADSLEREAKKLKLEEAINRVVNRRIDKYIKDPIFKDPVEGFRSYLIGTNKKRFSVNTHFKGILTTFMQMNVSGLHKRGVLKEYQTGALDREVYQWMGNLDSEGKVMDPSLKVPEKAKAIAEVLKSNNRKIREMLNLAGADIGDLDGYITRRIHSMDLIRRAGFDQWKKDTLSYIDPKILKDVENVDEFLEGIYDGLVSGVHLKSISSDNVDGAGLKLFQGDRNLARKVSQSRVLHFKDGNAEYEYNLKYGQGTLRDAINSSVEYSARNLAMLEMLGTRPEAMFEKVMGDIQKVSRKNVGIIDRIRGSRWMLTAAFKELDGSVNIPGSGALARFGTNVRSFMITTKLGGSGISTVTDIPNLASGMKYQGIDLGESFYKSLDALISSPKGIEERKLLAEAVGTMADSMNRNTMLRQSGHEPLSGGMAKLVKLFFTLNGQNHMTDRLRIAAADLMSNNLAKQSSQPFSKLHPDLQRTFKLYNITDAEWDAFRSIKFDDVDGRPFLDPSMIHALEKDDIVKFMERDGIKATPGNVKRYFNNIETKFRQYFADQADFAVPTPDAGDRVLVTFGTQRGTPLGEAIRFMMQFKSFSVTMINKVVGREIYGRGPTQGFGSAMKNLVFNGGGAMLGMARMIAGTTIFGYLALAAKDWWKGREHRRLDDKKTWLAALAQGGGLGIYSDFLFGEYNRYGRSFGETVIGPAPAELAGGLLELKTQIQKGEDFKGTLVKMGANNTPMLNLFYLRTAMDYAVIYQLQEMANPGYLRRMERKIERENKQHFFVPPSSVIPHGGSGPIGQGFVEGIQELPGGIQETMKERLQD